MKSSQIIYLLITFLFFFTNGYADFGQAHFRKSLLQLDIDKLDNVVGYTKTDKDGNEYTYLQRRLDSVVDHVTQHTQSEFYHHGADYAIWREHLRRPHPNIQTLKHFFAQAAQEFSVPQTILEAIAQVESNWTQIGPSIDQGWGIMHLVQNEYANTLEEAAHLLGLDVQILKDDAQQNIRGAAALLAYYAGNKRKNWHRLEDWFGSVTKLTGLIDSELRREQTIRYYDILKTGIQSQTLWGETLTLKSHPALILSPDITGVAVGKVQRSTEYPLAISKLIPCNFRKGRQREVDTWVNHWIGVGTYASALSRFRNCNANASAHFMVRASGTITQMVSIENTAMHTGVKGYWNNSRSIGIEHEVTITNPKWPTKMIKASAKMARYLTDKYGISQKRVLPGIRGHKEMPGAATACPGNFPWTKWMKYFKAVPAYTWQGNGSILSYYGQLVSQTKKGPLGITQDVVQLHPSLDQAVAFFQWQINENNCQHLKLDVPTLPQEEKQVELTIGKWNNRKNDITFAKVTLPFVLGPNNTDFKMADGDWFVVKSVFLNFLTQDAKLEAHCTTQAPTQANYQPGHGQVQQIENEYQWYGIGSVLSHPFQEVYDEQTINMIDWPYGTVQDVIVIPPSSSKAMVFFQWQPDLACPQLTLDAAGIDNLTVDISTKLWNASLNKMQTYSKQRLPFTFSSTYPSNNNRHVIQLKFRNPTKRMIWIEAKCFK
jgi:N-acetyl-anhydromuramyl-L-alanine amidase AmpD